MTTGNYNTTLGYMSGRGIDSNNNTTIGYRAGGGNKSSGVVIGADNTSIGY